MTVQIFIDLIPEFIILFSMADTTKIIGIYKFMTFALRCFFFNSFMHIDQFCNQTVVLLMILVLCQISLLLAKLKRYMIFICLNIEIIYLFLFLQFIFIFRKIQSMYLVFYCLLAYLCCETCLFTTTSVGCLHCLLKHFSFCIFCNALISF